MEIKRTQNPQLIRLNGVFVKTGGSLEKLFALDAELAKFADTTGVIQIEALAELGYTFGAQVRELKIGETRELLSVEEPALYEVTRLSKSFCISKILEPEFVFNEETVLYQEHETVPQYNEDREEEEELVYEYC